MSKGVNLAGRLEGLSNAQRNMGSFYVYDPDEILV